MFDPRHQDLLDALGADRVKHSKRTLAEHLAGTRALLEAWGNPKAVCTAGHFHSIYGTYVFPHSCVDLDRRPEIRKILGARAERLAYLFCVCERSDFFAPPEKGIVPVRDLANGTILGLDNGTVSALLEIEAANIVEHLPRRGRTTRASFAWYHDAFASRRALVSAGAASAILDALERFALPAAAQTAAPDAVDGRGGAN